MEEPTTSEKRDFWTFVTVICLVCIVLLLGLIWFVQHGPVGLYEWYKGINRDAQIVAVSLVLCGILTIFALSSGGE